MSKKTIDVYCHQTQVHKEFVNDIIDYNNLLKSVLKAKQESKVFYCFENTGYYSLNLALYLHSKSIVFIK